MIKIIDKTDRTPERISFAQMKSGDIGIITETASKFNGHYVLRGICEAYDLSSNAADNWYVNGCDWNTENIVQLLPKNEKIVIEIYNT